MISTARSRQSSNAAASIPCSCPSSSCWPRRGHRQSGDDAVLLAGHLRGDYAPDVLGLLEAWRRTEEDDDVTRNQIAWAACRARLSQLLEQLGAEIAGDPQTLARFIGAAASWAGTGDPPLTPAGDEPKAPEPARRPS